MREIRLPRLATPSEPISSVTAESWEAAICEIRSYQSVDWVLKRPPATSDRNLVAWTRGDPMPRQYVLVPLSWVLAMGCAPTVEITAPPDGEEVFEAVDVSVAVDGAEPDVVEVYLDQADEAHALGEAGAEGGGSHSLLWFTDATSNGAHTLIAEALVDGTRVTGSVEVEVANVSRTDAIPSDAVKMTPAEDAHPPILEPAFTLLFEDPVAVDGPVTTAGAEDSAYITPDGQELYFFFTPDASVPVNEQLVDRVTGVYRSTWTGSGWGEPSRVVLNTYDSPSLDGCETAYGDTLWFCTVRAGVQREIDIYTAHREGDGWVGWESAGERLNLEIQLGELHVTGGGDVIYFHSEMEGGAGGMDLWTTTRDGGDWGDPVNLAALNTEWTDGYPWVDEDEQELWFTHGAGAPEIWRSLKVGGEWQSPEKVVGPFAGEATFDAAGNLYFTHHFWDDEEQRIIEADIYVARRK